MEFRDENHYKRHIANTRARSKTYQEELPSRIHGRGVFAKRFIRKGERVWMCKYGLTSAKGKQEESLWMYIF